MLKRVSEFVSVLVSLVVVLIFGCLAAAGEAVQAWRARRDLRRELNALRRQARKSVREAKRSLTALELASAEMGCSRRAEIELLRSDAAMRRAFVRVESAGQLADDCLAMGTSRSLGLTRVVLDVREYALQAAGDLELWATRSRELQSGIVEAVAGERRA